MNHVLKPEARRGSSGEWLLARGPENRNVVSTRDSGGAGSLFVGTYCLELNLRECLHEHYIRVVKSPRLPSATMRLLIVEDETKTARYLKKGLSESGFAVDIASDGSSGLNLAQTCDYGLVILDIMLPRRDGWAVLHDLRDGG